MVLYVWGADAAATSSSSGITLDPEIDTSNNEVLLINTRCFTAHHAISSQSDEGPQDFIESLKSNEDLLKDGVPRFSVKEVDVLKLSAGQNHDDWVRLANLIQENYDKYCGFVVHNGTDNMVATATALSFMLENLAKPVVFTGSRIPGDRLYTDLRRNLIVALLFANCSQISEVCILFDERLLRANRTLKVSRSTLAPFDSPHFPLLATMRGMMTLHRPLLRPHPRGRFRVMQNMNSLVLTLKLGPSLPQQALLKSIELTEAKAIVIIAYGGGNGPTRGDYMRDIVKKAVTRDIVVVICTQNLYGTVDLSTYEAGEQLLQAGAISARDMTIDAAIMKLKYLLGVGLSSSQIKKFFLDFNLRGELSPQPAKI